MNKLLIIVFISSLISAVFSAGFIGYKLGKPSSDCVGGSGTKEAD